jgi:serine kinase
MSTQWNSEEVILEAYRQSRQNMKLEASEKKGYFIGEKIGHGNFSSVHLAEYFDNRSSKKIRLACKILKKDKSQDKNSQKFIRRELDILTKLENPNIIKVHSILQRGGDIYIFMYLADRGCLLEFIEKNGVVSELQAKLWFRQIAYALQYLHNMNIVHRDLKLENILLSKHFNAKLSDFSFARFYRDDGDWNMLSRTYCGTPGYTAPEVVSHTPYNPKAADIWSLGVILFTMLEYAFPFVEESKNKLLELQTKRRFVFRKHLSGLAKDIVRQMLEPDVTLRPTIDRLLENTWVKSAWNDASSSPLP